MDNQLLLQQFRSTYNAAGWFVPLNNAIEGLTPALAEWKPVASVNSIRQIVNHLLFWNRGYLDIFNGLEPKPFSGNNDATFEQEMNEPWEQTLLTLHDVFEQLDAALAKADAAKLDSPYKPGSNSTWRSIIGFINTHNAYHVGQIVLLRKIQGSWDPAKGVS